METMSGLNLLMSVLTMWTSTKAFALSLHVDTLGDEDEDDDVSRNQIVFRQSLTSPALNKIWRQYMALKDLSYMINQTIGSFSTCFLMEAVVYHAVYLDSVFMHNDDDGGTWWSQLLSLTFYFVHDSAVMLFAGDICYQVRNLVKIKNYLFFIDSYYFSNLRGDS